MIQPRFFEGNRSAAEGGSPFPSSGGPEWVNVASLRPPPPSLNGVWAGGAVPLGATPLHPAASAGVTNGDSANRYASIRLLGAPPQLAAPFAGESAPEKARPPKSANSPRVIHALHENGRKRSRVLAVPSVGDTR